MFDENDFPSEARLRAVGLFERAYEAQQAKDYPEAVELYRRSIETYPTAEAHTFLGWVYSFEERYDEAIDECLKAISVDPGFGNPYNDIGSYLLARGDLWTCVRWFKRAMQAPRYEARAYPHFNLGRVYEQRRRPLDAAHQYGLALDQQPGFGEAARALRRVQARLS
ncbi:MAG: tetratricopeptide repeat protein [Acidobacteria bacterium]|nr:tetratricopeptide repeat protein [Acidobacteriota bacterium]